MMSVDGISTTLGWALGVQLVFLTCVSCMVSDILNGFVLYSAKKFQFPVILGDLL